MQASGAVNGARRAAAARRPPRCSLAANRRPPPAHAPSARRERGEGGGGRGGAGGGGTFRMVPKIPKKPLSAAGPGPARPFLLRRRHRQGLGLSRSRGCRGPGPPTRPRGKDGLVPASPPLCSSAPAASPPWGKPVAGLARTSGSEGSEPGLFDSLKIPGPSARGTSAPRGASTPRAAWWEEQGGTAGVRPGGYDGLGLPPLAEVFPLARFFAFLTLR